MVLPNILAKKFFIGIKKRAKWGIVRLYYRSYSCQKDERGKRKNKKQPIYFINFQNLDKKKMKNGFMKMSQSDDLLDD